MTLFDQLAAGVRDHELPGLSISSGPSDVDAGHAATGWLSTVGPFSATAFAGALDALIVDDNGEMTHAKADPRFILSQPWRRDRTERSLSFEASSEPPELDVELLAFPGLPNFYRVIDGMHRSFAARRNGRHSLDVLLHRHSVCDPSVFKIQEHALYRKGADRPLRTAHDPEILRIWQCLGVETEPNHEREFSFTVAPGSVLWAYD